MFCWNSSRKRGHLEWWLVGPELRYPVQSPKATSSSAEQWQALVNSQDLPWKKRWSIAFFSHGKPNSTIQDKRFSIELQCCLLLCALFVCPGVFFNVNFFVNKKQLQETGNKQKQKHNVKHKNSMLVGCLFVCFPSSRFSMFYVLHFKHVRIQYVWQWTPWPQGNPNVFFASTRRAEPRAVEHHELPCFLIFSWVNIPWISHYYCIAILP